MNSLEEELPSGTVEAVSGTEIGGTVGLMEVCKDVVDLVSTEAIGAQKLEEKSALGVKAINGFDGDGMIADKAVAKVVDGLMVDKFGIGKMVHGALKGLVGLGVDLA